MKISHILASALLVAIASAHADDLTILDSNYSVTPYYTDPQANSVVSYDWSGAGDFYYMTQNDYVFTGVYEVSGGVNSTIDPATNFAFAGANLVTIGNNVYYNYSDFSGFYINKYGPTNGTPSLTLASTAPNYGIFGHDGQMFITAGDSNGVNDIYYSTLGSDGSLNGVVDLGVTSGNSGPLAFDSAGDLFYAPGGGDLSIYKWSAADVAAAIADPTNDPLSVTGHLWEDYSSTYSGVYGASSMLVEGNGDLLVTLTNFSGPSDLVDFSSDAASSTLILTDTNALGELRSQGGSLYLSAGDQIVQIGAVPEPSAVLVIALGLGLAVVVRQTRKAKARA
jgi:hypothetical protein